MAEKQLFSIEKIEQIGIPSSISNEKRSRLLYGLGLLRMNLRGEDGFTDAIEKFNLSIQENPRISYPYDAMGDIEMSYNLYVC